MTSEQDSCCILAGVNGRSIVEYHVWASPWSKYIHIRSCHLMKAYLILFCSPAMTLPLLPSIHRQVTAALSDSTCMTSFIPSPDQTLIVPSSQPAPIRNVMSWILAIAAAMAFIALTWNPLLHGMVPFQSRDLGFMLQRVHQRHLGAIQWELSYVNQVVTRSIGEFVSNKSLMSLSMTVVRLGR